MEAWYVIHTRPRQEARAEAHLQRQGFQCYLPRLKQRLKRRGQRVDVVEPLFPRYLFIQLDLSQQQNVYTIPSTRGVIGFVRFGERLPSVPTSFIQGLRQAADPQSGLLVVADQGFCQGERVVIESGPLAGMMGIFQEATGEERVIVLLEMLGRQNAVKMPRDAVARLA